MSDPRPTRPLHDVAQAQQRLGELGYDVGPIDGLPGPAFREAVSAFQAAMALNLTGDLDAHTRERLFSSEARRSPPRTAPPDPPVDGDEAKEHVPYVQRALEAESDAARDAALVEGFMQFGLRFIVGFNLLIEQDPAQFGAIAERASETLITWLTGQRYTDRTDEAERRALVAGSILRRGGVFAGLERIALRALQELPEGHPQRDEAMIRTGLRDWLGRVRTNDDAEGELLTIQDLLDHPLETDADKEQLIERGLAIADSAPDASIRRNFLVAAVGHYTALMKQEEDTLGVNAQDSPHVARVDELIARVEALGGGPRVRAKNAMLRGLHLETTGRVREAAVAFGEAVASHDLEPTSERSMARFAARMRARLGDDDEIIALLEPRIAGFEEDYLAAVDEETTRDAGEAFGEVCGLIADAYARRGRWSEAVVWLGHGKSLRLRQRTALRRSPEGPRLLAQELTLHAIARGLDAKLTRLPEMDLVGEGLSVQARALEQYRRMRPRVSNDPLLARPGVSTLAGSLDADEALVLFGMTFRGTVAAVLRAGDDAESATCRIFDDWTPRRLGDLFVTDDYEGWLMALGDRVRSLDPRPWLDRVLTEVGASLGAFVAAVLAERRLQRVHLVPHHLLQFVPFWAVPGLAEYEMTLWPSVVHFLDARGRAPGEAVRRAVAVMDPTLDLPLAGAEVAALQAHLQAAGVELTTLPREAATQAAVTAAAGGAGLLHFCGHGVADVSEPLRSGLLLAPDWSAMPIASAADLEPLAARVTEWRAVGEQGRRGRVADSSVISEEWPSGDAAVPFERRLDYADRGTLWVRYDDSGRVQRAAELWSAGDIVVDGTLAGCPLAVLSACKSGLGGLAQLHESSGLPAALLLAGVSTVVATLWPVSDGLCALYMDRFYEILGGHRGEVDLTALVKDLSAELRHMSRATARARVQAIRGRLPADARWPRFRLEAFAAQIERGAEQPFSHPYDWAAFHVIGHGRIRLPEDH